MAAVTSRASVVSKSSAGSEGTVTNKQNEGKMDTTVEEVSPSVLRRYGREEAIRRTVVCSECGEAFFIDEDHNRHTVECEEAFYMEKDHPQHSLDQHSGEVTEESSTEVSDESSTEVSECSTYTTKVSDDTSSKSEVEEKDTPDVVPDSLQGNKHNY